MNILLDGIWPQRMDSQRYHKLDTCKLQNSAASVISQLVFTLCRITPSVYLKQTNTLDTFGRFITSTSTD